MSCRACRALGDGEVTLLSGQTGIRKYWNPQGKLFFQREFSISINAVYVTGYIVDLFELM